MINEFFVDDFHKHPLIIRGVFSKTSFNGKHLYN